MAKYTGNLHQLCENGHRKKGNWEKVLQYIEDKEGPNPSNELREEALDLQGPNSDETPLKIAVVRAPAHVVSALLDIAPKAALIEDSLGRIPLHLACQRPTAGVGSASTPQSTKSKGMRSPGAESLDVLKMMINRHPVSVLAQDTEGRTPLHWLFLFYPESRSTYLVDLFLSEKRPEDMPPIPLPGPTDPETLSSSAEPRITKGVENEIQEASISTSFSALQKTVSVGVDSTTSSLPLPVYSSHAHVHTKSHGETETDPDGFVHPHESDIPPYPWNASAVPDHNNCLPLHYAVNMDDYPAASGELTPSSLTGGGIGSMATKDVVRHLVRKYPGSLLWKDVNNRTPLLWYLMGQDYYLSLLKEVQSTPGTPTSAARKRSPKGTGGNASLTANDKAEGARSPTKVTAAKGSLSPLDCSLPKLEEVTNTSSNGSESANGRGNQTPRSASFPPTPQPLLTRYHGASSTTLPVTVLTTYYPHKSSSIVNFLVNDEVCTLGDLTFGRTPAHWMCFLVVTSQIHSHLEYIARSVTAACCTETESRAQSSPDQHKMQVQTQGLENLDGAKPVQHEVCMSTKSFRTILETNPRALSFGDKKGMTPLHLLFHTAFAVNCVVYTNLNEEESARGAVKTPRGNTSATQRESAEEDSNYLFSTKVAAGESGGGSSCATSYWKTPPPPIPIPHDYVSILLEFGTDDMTARNPDLTTVSTYSDSHDEQEVELATDTSHHNKVSDSAKEPLEQMEHLPPVSDDVDGRLPLHYAAMTATSVASLRKLVDAHPMGLITTEDVFNRTPLHMAFSSPVTACHQTLSEVEVLLEGGKGQDSGRFDVDIDIGQAALKMEDAYGNYPLHLACENGASAQVIGEMIRRYNDAVWVKNENGDIPLMCLVGVHGAYERMIIHECCTVGEAKQIAKEDMDVARSRVMNTFETKWKLRKEKVDVLFQEFIVAADSDEVQMIEHVLLMTSSMTAESLLQIALWHEVAPSIIHRMISYASGKSCTRTRSRDGYLPIDMLELRRPPLQEHQHLARNIEAPSNAGRWTREEWEEVQDLLFVTHPSVLPHRRDEVLLSRLVQRIRREVRTQVFGDSKNDRADSKQGCEALKEKEGMAQVFEVENTESFGSVDTFDAMIDVLDSVPLEAGIDDESDEEMMEETDSPDDVFDGEGKAIATSTNEVKDDGHVASPDRVTNIPEESPDVVPMSQVAVMAWIFFVTYTNEENPEDNYAQTVESIVADLPHQCIVKLCELVLENDTNGTKELNNHCAQVLDNAFFLLGSFKFFAEPETVLPTGTTIRSPKGMDIPYLIHTSQDSSSVILKLESVVGMPTEQREDSGGVVCLKLMKNKKDYDREISSRNVLFGSRKNDEDLTAFESNKSAVVPIYHHYSSSGKRPCDRRYRFDIRHDHFAETFRNTLVAAGSHEKLKMEDFPYAVVMPFADNDLRSIFCHSDMSATEKKACAMEIGCAIECLHKNNIVHGDIRMRNVLRLNNCWTLSGMSSSCKETSGKTACHAGEIGRYHTGILPPEMFVELKSYEDMRQYREYWQTTTLNRSSDSVEPMFCEDGRAYVVKAFHPRRGRRGGHSLPYALHTQSASIDLWSFGCLVYTIFTGRTLFPTDLRRDDLTCASSYATLATWDESKSERIVYQDISDPLVQDLLLHLLAPVEERDMLSMGDILRHPFFTNQSVGSTLSAVSQKITGFRRIEARREQEDIEYERKLSRMGRCIEARTVLIRRVPVELQVKLDHAPSTLAMLALPGSTLKLNQSSDKKASGSDRSKELTPPLCFVILPYKLIPNKAGKLTPSSKKGVELAEKVGKQLLLISKAIDQYLLDPLQSARDDIVASITELVQVYEEAPKSYMYLIDELNGVPIVNKIDKVYPYVIPRQHASNAIMRYLPFLHCSVLHSRGSTGGLSGLVKLIFEGAFPHIPGSWTDAAKGLVHQMARDVMIGEIKVLDEFVTDLEKQKKRPEAEVDRFKSLRLFYWMVDPKMTFADLKRISEGGSHVFWTNEAGVEEVRKRSNPEAMLAAHRQRVRECKLSQDKDEKIRELERAMAEMGEKENQSSARSGTVCVLGPSSKSFEKVGQEDGSRISNNSASP